MSKFKFKADFEGYNELRKSDMVLDECKKYANQIQQIAGAGFTVEERTYPKRSGAVVKAATPIAYFKNLNGNILEKAWRAVRQ